MKIREHIKAASAAARKETDERTRRLLAADDNAAAFLSCKQQASDAIAESERIKQDDLMPLLQELGVKDAKGSISLSTERHSLQLQRRLSTSLDPEKARKLLRFKGLLDKVEKTRTETYLDEDEVAALHSQGLLTQDDLKLITTQRESFAFIVKSAAPKKTT